MKAYKVRTRYADHLIPAEEIEVHWLTERSYHD